ncbi:uncharacterized protein Z518_00652 [Rhinocladiella mackenziei CBS 650.93]|uniref:Major facilitator superfamily (MFS) profile domain-containing protein n=1 Tax=Rhinocladiella mackenziei CBS 650.93 TaxID=1442369 RepID=A0A0D2G4G8_9EURO|nr:uncharacterized protein Z518_00652 [Rhinocladiella mackenziei CBS 650.93]KIX09572.1 hypothetical protein Z518_00652 [Rhinocladiella mackenziei CBS 650.93]
MPNETDVPAISIEAVFLEKPTQDDKHKTPEPNSDVAEAAKPVYDFRFWVVFAMLMLSGAITALDFTIPAVALPSIARELNADADYAWISGSFGVSSAVAQPFYAQLADSFGRKPVMLTCIAIFTLGSGLCGGANSSEMLIAARTIQGLGAGGMMVVTDVIFCDIVPLRDRGRYMAMLMSLSSVLMAAGPVIGGAIVQQTTWRWVFYLQLPVCGVTLVALSSFLRLNHKRDKNWWNNVKRLDHIGNAIFSGSLVLFLVALHQGGHSNVWNSPQVIAPLVIGGVGLILFIFYERSNCCEQPMMPKVIYSTRTGASAILITLLACMLAVWVPYFLTVYFQAVKQMSPGRTGVSLLPQSVVILPFAMIGGSLLSKFGKYKPIHFVAQAGMSIGLGLFTMLDDTTPVAVWAVFQIIFAMASGLELAALLPAVQAPLPEQYVASSTALFSFMRSVGKACGIILASVIFNSQVERMAHTVPDESLQRQLRNGGAFGLASPEFIQSVPANLRPAVLTLYTKALSYTWYGGLGIALIGFLFVFFEKSIPLRTTLETEYGLARNENQRD